MGHDYSYIARNFARNCERAVVTAYRELRDVGTTNYSAFGACPSLYRNHHHEATVTEACRLVAEWIDHHVVRVDHSPTKGSDCN